MPIPTLNYASLPVQGDPLSAGIIPAIQRGIELYYQPKQMKLGLEKNQLANALQRIALQYAPRGAEADIKQQEAKASLPFGGHSLPGPAGEVLALESMRQLFGEQSPQYQSALNSFNLGQEGDRSRIEYQRMLSKTLPVRNLTPTGKSFIEQGNVHAGLSPSGNNYLNPPRASKEEVENTYDLVRQINAIDSDTRQRNRFSTNIEKSLSQIDSGDLTQYAGFMGKLGEMGQTVLSPFGKESKNFDNYKKAVEVSKTLAGQIRQFYGSSIDPKMLARLDTLVNPSTWTNNPKLAQELFNTTKAILAKEMKTYRDAMKGTDVYRGQELTINPTPEQEDRLVKSGIATKKRMTYDPSTGELN